jgi:hypothetical protein
MKHFSLILTVLIFLTLPTCSVWGQSFLGLDGGFEGAAIIDNTNTYTAAQTSKWTKSGTTITLANETNVVRSGANSLRISMTSTAVKRVYTPEYTIPLSTSKWYVQYYRRSVDTTNTLTQQPGILRDGSEQTNGSYSSVPAPDMWEKVTYAPTSTTAADTIAGVILTKAKGSGGEVYIDDFCIYAASTVDNVAPNSPTSPSISQTANIGELMVSWIDAPGGVDNGGYMVVRKIGNASSTTPHSNGIYAKGNTIAVGENVVYVGSSTSFIDTGLDPVSTYYYTVYTFDKAYNYSSGVSTSGDVPLPIQLASFSASSVLTGVTLNWTTATETNCYGFEVERRENAVLQWSKIGFVKGFGVSAIPQKYSCSDFNIVPGRYVYRLKEIDQDGTFRYYGNAEIQIGLLANTLTLSNYPNPFNPATTVVFSVPSDGHTTLKVFTMLGQEVATLFNGLAQSGRLNKVSFDGAQFSSGVYYCAIEYGGQRLIKRMLIVK